MSLYKFHTNKLCACTVIHWDVEDEQDKGFMKR